MNKQNSFIRNKMLYSSKQSIKKPLNIPTEQLSQFPQLGNTTVEGVKAAMLKAKQRAKQTAKEIVEEKDKKEDDKSQKSLEQYKQIQALYHTKIDK